MLISHKLTIVMTVVAVVASTAPNFAATDSKTFDSTSAKLLQVAAAEHDIPVFNVFPSCRAAAASQIAPTNRMQTCMMSERLARDRIINEWTNFSSVDRAICVGAMMNFEPTYTELITCLEIASDAKKLSTKSY